jgi:hypothetical protein
MTEQQFLTALARALTRREDLLRSDLRPQLLELLLRIRALLLESFAPTTSAPLRSFLYSQLRPEILALIQPFANAYYASIRTILPEAHADLRRINATLFNLSPSTLPTPTLEALLTSATVLNRSARALLAPSPTGLSPITLQLERLLDTTILAAILRDEPTDRLTSHLFATTSAGPTIRKGTVSNAWLERLRATNSALLWSLVTSSLTEAAALSARPPDRWQWNAVLDPATCPRCRPLHGTTAASPEDFPEGPSPLHPFCRCFPIPLWD